MDQQTLTNAITKALAYTENGGHPDANNTKAGKTGELKSIFQFEPSTWKTYSKEVTGQSDTPITPEAEAYVVHQKVADWVKKGKLAGKSDDQIAAEIGSEWNSGNPNAYQQNHVGVNKKYGVKYDTPGYSKKVVDYTNEFLKGGDGGQVATKDAETNAKMDTAVAAIKSSLSPQVNTGLQSSPQQVNTGLLPRLAQQVNSAPKA